jgi:drug/metabolite transporter (DMT)-like permease
MNLLSYILCVAAALVLLLVSVLIGERPQLHNPLGVLALFAVGLFISLGFLLFGHMRFDELLGEHRGEDPSCS